MDLPPAKIQFSYEISPHNSEKLSDELKHSLKGENVIKLEGVLPFFIPKVTRQKSPENDRALGDLQESLELWLNEQFPRVLPPAIVRKIVNDAVKIAAHTAPHEPLDSPNMDMITEAWALSLFMKFLWGNTGLLGETPGNCGGPREGGGTGAVEKFTELVNSILGTGESKDVGSEILKMKDLGHPILRYLMGAVYDVLSCKTSTWKGFQKDQQKKFLESVLWATQCHQLTEGDEFQKYPLDMLEYLRAGQSPLLSAGNITATLRDSLPSRSITEHPLCRHWLGLAQSLDVKLYDLLRIQDKIQEGECASPIFHKVLLKGLPIAEAFLEEVDSAGGTVQEYLKSRKLLLKNFAKNGKLEEYVGIVDSYLYGAVQVYLDTVGSII